MIHGSEAPELRDELVAAIQADGLSTWADTAIATARPDSDRGRVAASVHSTCATIRASNERERDRLVEELDEASIGVADVTMSHQRHTLTIDVAAGDAPRAFSVLLGCGYRVSRSWTGGARASFWRAADSQLFTRDGPATTVVRLRWRQRRRSRLHRVFGPTSADWDVVETPESLWWVYPVIRPARLAAERLGLRSSDHSMLEPFLVTPYGLVGALLDVASVGRDDVVFDFGCGDGRFVVAAAVTRGCRSIGVEQSPELCAAAVERAAAAEVADRVRIVNDDAARVDLSEVTVVVLFLPMVVASRVVPDLLARLPQGARIVLHEQTALAPSLPAPEEVLAVVVDDAVTVAHRWVVQRDR
ncbi:MAG: class I SAM-dependent methyltransferase [Ilumatobacteraceae bacterium]